MLQNDSAYVKKPLPDIFLRFGFILLIVGLIMGVANFFISSERALFGYLLGYVLLVSIGVGALFLIALEYVAGADWSVPIRRVVEYFAAIVPILIILAIPIFLNLDKLFHWTHPGNDEILLGKAPYLNTSFFIIRIFICCLIWSLFYFFVTRNSQKQDTSKDQKLTTINIRFSAVFIPFFAITITVAAMDLMMSLEPHWFSTIFGVYFFASSVLASLSVVTLGVLYLKNNNFLSSRMTNDHLFSLGALLFAFINFWAYIAFSQYLLIWYANLPEENFWFLHRWEGGWAVMSILLIITHFVVPYALLLSQPAKMDPKRLRFAAIWILFAHLLDLYWLIMPQYHGDANTFISYVLDIGFPLASIGLLIIVFYFASKNKNLVAVGDPKLERGLNFRL